jgi:DNA-binding HxlR family transcriptional regulator
MKSDDTPDPLVHCLSVVGGKWKLLILYVIDAGSNRFGAMQREIPGITKQMLAQQLRELEADGILHRKIFAEIPPRVEYTITKRGKSLLGIVTAMKEWGEWDLAADENDEDRDQLALRF